MRLGHLGYAITAHRAQGITVDTAHTLTTATTTRENFYVSMTRGRYENHAYVATDPVDDAHVAPHPSDNPDATARSVLYGVLQHVGAELSAHETIEAEQERWGSIWQLVAEYETIADAAQQDRWATLLVSSGLTEEQVDAALSSDAFGALTTEMRRAEANHYDLNQLMPRLVQIRDFEDADDIAAVLHWRVTRATERPHGSGRIKREPDLIAGLIPEAQGITDPDLRQALTERRELIEQRALAVLERDLAEKEPWTVALGQEPEDERNRDAWRRQARVVAAYRDRYGITDDEPLGSAGSDPRKIDAARAAAALRRARQLTHDRADQDRQEPVVEVQRGRSF